MSFTELGQVCVGLDSVCVDGSCRCVGQNVWSTEWLNDQLECQVWIGSDSEWAVIAFMPCSVSDLIQQLNLNTWQEWDYVFLQAMKSFVCVCVCRKVLCNLKASSKSILRITTNPHAWSQDGESIHIYKHTACLQGPTCPLWNVSKLQRPFTNVKGAHRLCMCVWERVLSCVLD